MIQAFDAASQAGITDKSLSFTAGRGTHILELKCTAYARYPHRSEKQQTCILDMMLYVSHVPCGY